MSKGTNKKQNKNKNLEIMKIEFTHTPIVHRTNGAIELKNIEKIYLGKGEQCRCGCGGEYTYLETSGEYVKGEPKKIERMLKRFSKFAETREVTSSENYIFEVNVSKTGETNRVMTIMLKQN
jgi:hypothetical protein